jgi:hypothetical protein
MSERIALRSLDGRRFRCRAVVARFGTKAAYRGDPIPTILLRDVTDADLGKPLTDHLWFTRGKWSDGLELDDVIEFEARSGAYLKGYRGRREGDDLPSRSLDWRLQRPTKVRVVRDGEAPERQAPEQLTLWP